MTSEDNMANNVGSNHDFKGSQSSEGIVTFATYRQGISREDSIAIYNHWASTGLYEQDLNEKMYHGPKVAADAVGEFFPSNRDNKLILDVACGSGLVGHWLHKQGFTRLHGLDPSLGMLELAREKNIYDKFFSCYVDSNLLPMDADTYDCVISSGGFGEGHIPASGLRQLARVVKPGGLVCFVMRECYLEVYQGSLEEESNSLKAEGVWRPLSRTVVPGYSYGTNGIMFKFVIT